MSDYTVTTREGVSTSYSPINDFLYNSATRSSAYLNTYTSIIMQASGNSGRRGNSVTYGETNRSIKKGENLDYQNTYSSAPILWHREFFNLGRDARALHVLHEIIHQFATDIALANRIAIIKNDRENNRIRTFSNTGDASIYLNEYLSTECNLPTS